MRVFESSKRFQGLDGNHKTKRTKSTSPAQPSETHSLPVIFLLEGEKRKEGNQEYFPFFLSSGIPEEKGGGIPSLFPSFPLFLPTFLPDG